MSLKLRSFLLEAGELFPLQGEAQGLSRAREWRSTCVQPGGEMFVMLLSRGRRTLRKLRWERGDAAFKAARSISYARRCLIPVLLDNDHGGVETKLVAGVWHAYPSGEPRSFTLLTDRLSEPAGIHLIPIDKGKWSDWLSPTKDVRELLRPSAERLWVEVTSGAHSPSRPIPTVA